MIESGGRYFAPNAKEGWRQNTVGADVGLQGRILEQKNAITAKWAGPIAYNAAGAKYVGEFNAENGTNLSYQTITPGTAPVLVDNNNNNQPVKFGNDGSINAVKTTTQASSAANVSQQSTTLAATPAAPAGPKFREPGYEQESPGQFKSREKEYDTQVNESAKVTGEDIGNAKKNFGKDKSRADYLIKKIDELETHPGFKKAVGVFNSDLGGIPVPFGATVTGMIPGTDVTNWNKRFKEVQGQSYLQGIQELKGTGAITEKEGQAAQDAITRMSVSTDEKEFKQAAADFKAVIKRGIDRQARKAGQKPVYNEPEEGEDTEQKTKTNVPYKVVG
jgi:hypothetical protein